MTIPRKASILAAAAVLCAAAALPALAQYDDFSGGIRIGYRAVDVSGNDNKYREDIDLDDGPRLFELSFHFVPQEGDAAKQMVDRINLDVNNFGGDPFETLSLGVQRFDRFEFRYNRSKSEYFYNDTLGTLPDLHGFDFERVRDHASLDLDLTKRATFTFGFDRFTKTGNSTTTLDVQRDEFEFDKPIDESLNDYQVGFSYAWNEVTLTVEEQVRDYQNLYEIFLPGQSQGEDAEDSAVLDFFFLDQPYDYSANTHVARIVATPGKWIVRGQVMLQDLDLDLSASESSSGTSFVGSPFTTNVNGRGQVDRQMDLFDLDLTYALNDRFAIIGGAYSRSLDQDGDFLFGDELNRGKWKIDTTGFEGGVEVVATDSITLSGGVRVESRDVDRGVLEGGEPGEGIDETESHSTDQTGFFGTFAYRPAGSAFRLTAEVDDSSYDDPFTETSPTDRLRWRVRGDYGLGHGFSVAGSYLSHTSDNNDSGWDSSYDQATLRLAYSDPKLSASLGYGLVDVERRIDKSPLAGSNPIDLPVIFYEINTDYVDGQLRWSATSTWVVGGSFRFYDNSGTFGLTRDDVRAFVDYVFPTGYTAGVAYRTVSYSEDANGLDDYDADILELSVGYRW